MSNPSLQEQLKALVSPTSTTDKVKNTHSITHANPKTKTPRTKPAQIHPGQQPSKKVSPPKPAWLEQMFYGIELLKAYYPECFKEPGETKPLKVGIKQDLVKHLSTLETLILSDKACMIKCLSYYVSTLNYYKCVVAGATRIDLEGNPAGLVTAEEATYSAEQHKLKLEKKANRSKTKTP